MRQWTLYNLESPVQQPSGKRKMLHFGHTARILQALDGQEWHLLSGSGGIQYSQGIAVITQKNHCSIRPLSRILKHRRKCNFLKKWLGALDVFNLEFYLQFDSGEEYVPIFLNVFSFCAPLPPFPPELQSFGIVLMFIHFTPKYKDMKLCILIIFKQLQINVCCLKPTEQCKF